MLRTKFTQSSRLLAGSTRTFTSSVHAKVDGQPAGDAFGNREKAEENMYIRREEKAKLKALLEKVEAQKVAMTDLTKALEKELGEDKDQKK